MFFKSQVSSCAVMLLTLLHSHAAVNCRQLIQQFAVDVRVSAA